MYLRFFLPIVFAVLLFALVGSTQNAYAITGFQGSFDPSKWTFFTETDGFVDTSGAPNSIALTGGDAGFREERPTNTDFTIVIPIDGVITFDWEYLTFDRDGPGFDPAGFLNNGVFFQITNNAGANAQAGSEAVFVEAGTVFGFRIDSTDDRFGRGALASIFNFVFTPNPFPASGTIFGAAHIFTSSPSTLYTIDRSTGSAIPVGPIGFKRCSGIDFHPDTLILYGTCQRIETTQQVLITINTSTGEGTEVGPFDHEGVTVTDISFRNSDNTLYAYLKRQNALGTINTVTGAMTELGLTGVSGSGNGMAFSLDDTLFHANQVDLNSLDQDTGSATFVADMDYVSFDPELDFTRINGMDFDPSSGQLFVSINNAEEGGGGNFFGTLSTNPGEAIVIGETVDGLDAIAVFPTVSGGGGSNEPPTIGRNLAGNQQMVPTKGICIDIQCWTVTENFHTDFKLVEMFTSEHTISNTIYCANGVDKCNHITLSAEPYGTDINSAIWKVSVDKNFRGELTITVDDPDSYLGVTTCTAQVQAEKYWFTSCTIDFKKPMPGMMLGVQVWDTYKGVRNFYFNDGIEIIDTYGYPSVDTEFESSLDVPRLCLVDNPDKRTSCAFAEKVQLEIERAEKLLT